MIKKFKVASSPDRYVFQKEAHIKKRQEEGLEPMEEYIAMLNNYKEQDEKNIVDPEWRKDNLEYDLRSTEWICEKVKNSDNYAQNLYAAMCNNEFQKLEVFHILKDQRWSCSWRSAGGIIANMQEKGDYIDWYCSGIGDQDNGYGLSHQKPELDKDGRSYVAESVVTDEIREDLKKLGWIVVEYSEDELI